MSAKHGTIAVVIPAYNSAQFLDETLDSILAQTRLPDDIIIVDDGSTDDTPRIAQARGGLIRYFRLENGGQGRARAYGIAQSSADWIALCDSDDLWQRDHIERRLQMLDRYPDAQMTFSDFYSFGPNSNPDHNLLAEAPEGWMAEWMDSDEAGFYRLKQSYPAVLAFNPAYLSGAMFRRDSYHAIGGFNTEFSRWIGEDSEFIRRFAALEKAVFVGDTRQTWGYRRHGNNYSLIQWRNINAKADILDAQLAGGVVPQAFVAATQAERDWVRCRAFDQACWERERKELELLYAQLPAGQRNFKRRVKYILSRVGVFV